MENTKPAASKAASFYEKYERKETWQEVSHYCPGCGHGIIHKLVAAVIDQLEIQDRTVFLSPVGCAVFGYYYFDTGNIQCSHGRAPAVATGLKRSLEDSVVISYQGDGDLAAIGMTEIIHAANRGEMITVIFVNNATYGMTGGQMAPTTPLNQKTLTTPYGRSFENDGLPIDMCKLIDSLEAPVFIQRCSVSNTKEIVKTKKAIRKGLENQINRVGFSFIEILSPCPTNWKMSAIEARSYIDGTLSQIFELKTFRDKSVKREQKKKNWLNESDLYSLLTDFTIDESSNKSLTLTAEKKIIMAGFGGQGILFAAKVLATCALIEKRQLSYLPSYGPEMRGGNARVDVIISPLSIGSPLIDECDCFVAFNQSSYDSFVDKVKEKGVVIKNTSLVKNYLTTKKLTEIGIAATEIAQKFGMPQGANIVLITALIFQTKLFLTETLKQGLSLILKQQEKLTKNWNLVEQTMLLLSN